MEMAEKMKDWKWEESSSRLVVQVGLFFFFFFLHLRSILEAHNPMP